MSEKEKAQTVRDTLTKAERDRSGDFDGSLDISEARCTKPHVFEENKRTGERRFKRTFGGFRE